MSLLARRSFGKGGACVIRRYFDRMCRSLRGHERQSFFRRRARAGTPATTLPGLDVTRDDGSRADECTGADRGSPPSTTAPEPIDAPRSTTVVRSTQSSTVCRAPDLDVARGVLSFTNITPWPTKTSSSIVTPSQMNVWLWILHRAPMTTPRWISTNGPIRVSSPIDAPVQIRERMNRDPPRRTRRRRSVETARSLVGPSATIEP